jgi:hypothetical protein
VTEIPGPGGRRAATETVGPEQKPAGVSLSDVIPLLAASRTLLEFKGSMTRVGPG